MGRHGTPDGELGTPADDEQPAPPGDAVTDPSAPQPDDDQLTTLGRRTRAERRREGSLPPGEDPLSGRPVRTVRPTPPPPAPEPAPDRSSAPPAAVDPPRPAVFMGPATTEVPIPQPAPPGRRGPDTAPPTPGPSTTADPLTADPLTAARPPAGRAPGTSSLPSWAATPGPPTPPEQPRTVATPADRRDGRPEARAVPPLPPLRESGSTRAPSPAPVPDTGSASVPGPGTGPVGRAAGRAERQAADAVRRRDERRRGVTVIPPPPEEDRPRGSRRLVIGLVSLVVIALVLLSVWSFSRSDTNEASSTAPAVTTSAAAPATSAAPATTEPAAATTEAPVATGPVFAPVSVLNSAGITGLAASIGDELTGGGWEIRTLGVYGSDDVATTTVFYTAGDATQQQAAASLVAQFPEISGPVERFFEIPDLPDPGIVVIATGSWRP